MPNQTRTVAPGPNTKQVVAEADGRLLDVPMDWELLRPGDATLTRRVKAAGPSWVVKEKKGRRTFSLGVWAPRENIAAERERLEVERSSEAYAKRKSTDRERRNRKQAAYVEDFRAAVLQFLNFDDQYAQVAADMADAVTTHATPIGSGTVARTSRIPVERRAEAAVIAWMRHHTTAYDNMKIARVRGKRREVRRQLAAVSKRLLEGYRVGLLIDPRECPLSLALQHLRSG